MGTMTRILILALSISAVGCTKLAESIIQAGLDEMFEPFEGDTPNSYSPPLEPNGSTSLAFLTGTRSGNVECYIIGSGGWDPMYVLGAGHEPVGIAIADPAGVMVTTDSELLRGQDPVLTSEDLERQTGATEFGLLAAVPDAPSGEVVVAATTPLDETILVRIDANNGSILGTTEPRPATGVAGLTVIGNTAIVAETPTGDIVCYDLTEPGATGVVLVSGSDMVGQPSGMSIGPAGTLYVASADEPIVQVFDIDSGVEVDRFRINALGFAEIRDIELDPYTGDFLVTTGTSAIHTIDGRGNLLRTHSRPSLEGMTSIAILPR